jgi:hypothetical protein
MVRTCGTSPVCLVSLVDLVYLVGLVQPNKRDRPNKPDRPNNGLLTLADFFSILLDVWAGLVRMLCDRGKNERELPERVSPYLRSVKRESSNVKGFGGRAVGSPTFHLSRFLRAQQERRVGKGASLGKEAVLADSGRVGEVAAGAGRVRKETFSASC